MEYFAEGKRSIIYKTVEGSKVLLTKTEKPGIQAQNRIGNEVKWLRLLNKKEIGPKLVRFTENSFTYEFVRGKFIVDWIEHHDKKEIMKVLKEVLKQCRTLDKLKVTKEEMHHPVKHIIIEEKPVMIDFERCHVDLSPKNVTQFFQFLSGRRMRELLGRKGISLKAGDLRGLLQNYKEKQTDSAFQRLLGLLGHGA